MSLILKTLTGESLKSLQGGKEKDEGFKGLAKGRQVRATVVGAQDNGLVKVRIMGATVLADSQTPLYPGQNLDLTVEETSPQLVLSLSGKNQSGGQAGKLAMALQEMLQSRERLAKDMGGILEFDSTKQKNPLPEQSARILSQLKQALADAAISADKAGDPETLRRLLSQTGMNLENRLAKILQGRAPALSQIISGPDAPLPAETLRGLAKALTRQLGLNLGQLTDPDAAALAAFKELFSSAQGLGNALEAAQQLNAELLPQKDMLYLPLPLLFDDQLLGGELLMQLPGREGGQDREGNTRLVFFLNMSALGPITIEAFMRPGKLSGHFIVADDAKAEFIRERLGELITSLEQAGFQADFRVRARSAGEPADASPLADLIRSSGRSLSITV
jgi:hypothetical protein